MAFDIYMYGIITCQYPWLEVQAGVSLLFIIITFIQRVGKSTRLYYIKRGIRYFKSEDAWDLQNNTAHYSPPTWLLEGVNPRASLPQTTCRGENCSSSFRMRVCMARIAHHAQTTLSCSVHIVRIVFVLAIAFIQ